MKNGKRTGKITVFLGAVIVMCAVAGCGNNDGSAEDGTGDIIRIESSSEDGAGQTRSENEKRGEGNGILKDGQENADSEEEKAKDNQGTDAAKGENEENEENDQRDETEIEWREVESDTELSGDVKSIGENSIVVSKIHHYVQEDQGTTEEGVAVSYAGAVEDTELITFLGKYAVHPAERQKRRGER